jgi:hypothetical protein
MWSSRSHSARDKSVFLATGRRFGFDDVRQPRDGNLDPVDDKVAAFVQTLSNSNAAITRVRSICKSPRVATVIRRPTTM